MSETPSYPALIELISRLEGEAERLQKENDALCANIEKLRSTLKLIFSCGVQQEDVISNKYKIVIPEYVLFEVEGLMNEAMGKRDE